MKPVTERLVWDRFCQAVEFKRQIGLYDTVRTNENYFIGNQWEGVQAKGLPTPVFNFLKRVVLFQVATITSDNMTLQAAPLLPPAQFPARRLEEITEVLNGQFAALFESARLTTRIRELMRNSAVDGDGCMYFCFDPDVENGQPVKGEIQAEVVENTRVHFGNPNLGSFSHDACCWRTPRRWRSGGGRIRISFARIRRHFAAAMTAIRETR